MSLNASSPPLVLRGGMDLGSVLDWVTVGFYLLTVGLGLPGNALVIWVAGFKLKPNVTNVWLVNLAAADLVFCLSRVLSLLKKLFFTGWPFGVVLCKFNGFFKYANMFGSVFLLAAISLDRALCVWRPVFTRRHRTTRAARGVAALVWAAAVAFSAPYFAYRRVYLDKRNETKCSLEVKEASARDHTAKHALYSIRFLCGFLLPFMVILACYILAGAGIRRTRLSGKSRTLRILATLVAAFFLCWAPYHCLLLAKMVNGKSVALDVSLTLAKGLAYLNSCVNPLLYFCMGLEVRGCLRQGLAAACARGLAGDDGDGPSSRSLERTVDDSGGSGAVRLNAATEERSLTGGGTGV